MNNQTLFFLIDAVLLVITFAYFDFKESFDHHKEFSSALMTKENYPNYSEKISHLQLFLNKICRENSLSVPTLYIDHAFTLNAYVEKFLWMKNKIYVDDFLMESLSIEELEVIIAHEVGHIKNKDIVIYQVIRETLSLAMLYLLCITLIIPTKDLSILNCLRIWALFTFGSFSFMIILFIPWMDQLLNKLSQYNEIQADVFSVRMTSFESFIKVVKYFKKHSHDNNQSKYETHPEWDARIYEVSKQINSKVLINLADK